MTSKGTRMYQIDDYVDEYGINPYSEWKAKVKSDDARTAISKVSCLKHAGMKCPFVKDLKLEEMHELRSKSDKIRVYFFKYDVRFIILGAGFKDTQRQDIADCLERMRKIKRFLMEGYYS